MWARTHMVEMTGLYGNEKNEKLAEGKPMSWGNLGGAVQQ